MKRDPATGRVLPGFSEPPYDRMMRKVVVDVATGCWNFTGAKNAGYGMVGLGGKADGIDRCSRVMWRHTNGPIPPGLHVCHHCDNRACVNPAHLFLGDDKANADDRDRKGRVQHGERHYKTSLTLDQARAIKQALPGAKNRAELARQFGVTYATLQGIAEGRTWKRA